MIASTSPGAGVDQQPLAAGFDQIRIEHRVQQITAGRQFGERCSAGFVNIHHHRDGRIAITVLKRRDDDIAKLANAFAVCHPVLPAGRIELALGQAVIEIMDHRR